MRPVLAPLYCMFDVFVFSPPKKQVFADLICVVEGLTGFIFISRINAQSISGF